MGDVNKEYLSWLDDKENSRYTLAVLKSTMTSLKNYVYKKIKNPNIFFFRNY